MALEKEARTNFMGPEIDKRNRNWDKVSAHLAENAEKHIKDSGSNDHGYWVRYDNGEMECWGVLSVTTNSGGGFTHGFPQRFTSDNIYAGCSVNNYNNRDILINAYGQGNGVWLEGWVYGVGGAIKANYELIGRYYARGRWK